MRLVTAGRATYLMAGVFAAALAYGVMRTPVQVSDSLTVIESAQRAPSIAARFISASQQSGYLRPLFYTQVKVLHDAAGGRYWLAYRGFHALLLALALFLFVRALRAGTWTDFASAAFALVVLTGLHTFRGLVREAFPINHYLEIVVFSLIALNLAQARHRWWIDAAAAVTFAAASLTLESGLLVWVVLASARLCGLRGVSRRGLAAVTMLMGAYFWLRFGYYGTGVPGLDERSTGLWFSMLEREDLIARFGPNPLWLYVYNVAASALSIFFSEPDGGLFEITRAWTAGSMLPRMYLALASSVLATALVAWAAAARFRRGDRPPGAGDRLMFVAAAVIGANAVMSYAYTKPEIISVAGVFYAFAAFAAMRYALERLAEAPRGVVPAAAAIVLVAASALWTMRAAGVYHMQRVQAFKVRMDWAYAGLDAPADPASPLAVLIQRLRNDALDRPAPNPYLRPRWMDRWWGE